MKNIENYKIYHIILLLTATFILIFFNSFYHIQIELKTIATQNQVLIAKEIEYTISSWFSERIINLENSVKYINNDELEDEKKLRIFLEILLHNNYKFDAIQLLIQDMYFYYNKEKIHDFRENPIYIHAETKNEPTKLPWFTQTKNNLYTSITTLDNHADFRERTLHICTPVQKNTQFKGVLCGILKGSSLFQKIDNLQFPQKAYYFIMNTKGKILTGLDNVQHKEEIKDMIQQKMDHEKNFTHKKIISDNHVITLTKLQNFDWYIGVGMSKDEILKESAGKVTSHAMVLFLCFILLLITVNGGHTFLRRRIEKKQKEYEYILTHHSRITEIGKLVAGINHQLKQPLNAITLVISNTLDMSERNILDKQTLESNLQLCQKSTLLMDKTIGIFRNFYRCNEHITHFKLFDCIQSVLYVIHVDLARHNLYVELDEKSIEHIEVESIDNYIQQILLVLIQNAKDALVSISNRDIKEISQKIKLVAYAEFGKVHIEIVDWGSGISNEVSNTLFSEFKSSKKYEGTGIGLYFAKKLAQEKLYGDIVLKNRLEPTIFNFTFAQYLEHKD